MLISALLELDVPLSIMHPDVNEVFHSAYKHQWVNGWVGQGVAIRIGRFPVQNSLGARLGLGTQPRYEAPGDLRVEYVQKRSD